MKTEFVIITTTYERPIEIIRCLESVQNQTYKNFKHIIVNDSPATNYSKLEEKVSTLSNVIYIKNENNLGKNASVNKVFQILKNENFSDYIIFLDDDDWLDQDCLLNFESEIQSHSKPTWLVSNRALESGISITKNKTNKNKINYYWDYLITRKFSGDATHCINFKATSSLQLPTLIKNAEEWLYFAQVSEISKDFVYKNFNGTYTGGYMLGGVTDTYHKKVAKWKLYKKVCSEVSNRGICNMYTFIYMSLRLIKLILK